ncbi:ABC-three component system middle component 1 [Robertmurraya kyonggiensis]|uniref:Uncharacterized protein n=1 Tax=Robertmurraya kyonggiensis TaxID=1037680 RepID=A0A4U1D0T6_9BACI|nr:ABC-three component system middle component 1 [Robertmurraya kyonggiensis]TKC14757.1 hypothetical protein FA727_21180 [Robertmurraya kyonggiensis]
MDKQLVLNWLLKHGFVVQNSEQFYPDIFLEKEHLCVVVKEYKEEIDEGMIINDSVDIRIKLKKMNRNSWNCYFLILLSSKSEISPYIIEKDPRGVRKYVIKDYQSFKRIPFLDFLSIHEVEKKIDQVSLLNINRDKKLQYLLEYIIKSGGNSRTLKSEEINSAFNILFDAEDQINEN